MARSPPSSILIVGSGVFGLSTAYSLSLTPFYIHTKIQVLDRSHFPSPDGSSIDTSRIIRADYHDAAYANLAAQAQCEWRKQGPEDLGGERRYSESGLVLVADAGVQGEEYVKGSYENVVRMMKEAGDGEGVEALEDREAIEKMVGTGGGSGCTGYVNRRSGWANAEAGMRWLRGKVEGTKRVNFLHAEVVKLVKEDRKVIGVRLKSGEILKAELVILATGAWTGKLIDLRGRATATGQVLLYLDITDEEQEKLGKMPVLLNVSHILIVPV
jgi:sarcosine oxidase/L-pipecolate oxidase